MIVWIPFAILCHVEALTRLNKEYPLTPITNHFHALLFTRERLREKGVIEVIPILKEIQRRHEDHYGTVTRGTLRILIENLPNHELDGLLS